MLIAFIDDDQIALSIDAENTSANVINVDAGPLTQASGMYMDLNSLTTGNGIYIDWDDSVTTSTNRGDYGMLRLDYVKTGDVASMNSVNAYGLNLSMLDQASNNAGTLDMTGIKVRVDSASTNGLVTNHGMTIEVTDGDTNNGIELKCEDGAGSDIQMMSSTSSLDYCAIATGVNGATTITTVDNGGTSAHLSLIANGNIALDSDNDIALDASNMFTCTSGSATFTSSSANRPLFHIKNTANDDTGPYLYLTNERDGAGLENGDGLGTISFSGDDVAGSYQDYVTIVGNVIEANNTDETG